MCQATVSLNVDERGNSRFNVVLFRRAVSSTAPAPPPPSAAGQVATSLTSFSDPVYDMMSQVWA